MDKFFQRCVQHQSSRASGKKFASHRCKFCQVIVPLKMFSRLQISCSLLHLHAQVEDGGGPPQVPVGQASAANGVKKAGRNRRSIWCWSGKQSGRIWIYCLNYWHILISKGMSGFTSNTLLIRSAMVHWCAICLLCWGLRSESERGRFLSIDLHLSFGWYEYVGWQMMRRRYM